MDILELIKIVHHMFSLITNMELSQKIILCQLYRNGRMLELTYPLGRHRTQSSDVFLDYQYGTETEYHSLSNISQLTC